MRPALVLADAGRDDWILCQITSTPYGDPRALLITDADFTTGSLQVASYARPGKLFTAHRRLMITFIGQLKSQPFEQIVDAGDKLRIMASECNLAIHKRQSIFRQVTTALPYLNAIH